MMYCKRYFLLAFTFGAIATLAGCAAGPDYRRPAVVEPESVKYEQGWQTMPRPEWVASGEWWSAFDDETLSGLVERANEANQTLAQAEASYRAARAQWRFSRGEFVPQINSSLDANWSGGSDQNIGDDYSARLGLSWAPDFWGRVRRQVEAERAALAASAADLAGARLSIQVAVAQSYIRLRALERQRAILEQTMAAYDRSAQLTRNQYEAGIVSRADVIQAETQRQSLRSDLYDLSTQRAREENTIAVLLGRAPSQFDLAQQNRLPGIPALPAEVPSVLIARRPDVVAAERQVAAANARIGVAQAAWLPDISISAMTGVEGESFSELLDAPTRFWSVGPNLALTLFDGGRRRATRDIAVARYDEQVAAYRQTVLDSLREIEDALATLALLAEKAGQQQALIELAEENERVVTNRYRAGLVSFLEVATAQNTTLNARRAAVNITADRLAAAVQLAAVLGGGWTVDDELP